MRLTTKATYGLRICVVLALNKERSLSASELSGATEYSLKYVEKLMKHLKAADIVLAERGAGGGYRLGESPGSITLGRVLRALEDNLEFTACLSGCKSSSGNCGCPSYGVWNKLYTGINAVLDSMTLQEIADDYRKSGGIAYEKDIFRPRCNDGC
jgi:Rrf2 family protein